MPQKKSHNPSKLTPAMRQYQRFKQQHPDCVLFFRMGDFYEMFYEDAELAHRVLGVTLTQRTEGVPMAGVPYHAVEGYLRRMIQAGYRVAICDQVQDPAEAKGVVDRDVTRVITPGTLTDESMLDDGATRPLAAIVWSSEDNASIAWADLSTGEFQVMTLPAEQVTDELSRIGASELLAADDDDTGDLPPRVKAITDRLSCVASLRPGWQFESHEAGDVLRKQFGVATLEGFGFADDDPALPACGAIVHYLLETQRVSGEDNRLTHLRPPRRFRRESHLVIDDTSLRSLEVERTVRSQSTEGSLLGVLQGCRTAMGKRTLRHWLCYPLSQREPIQQRQGVVATLVADARLLDELRDLLDGVQDVQRIVGRISVNRATPRDLVGLGGSVKQAEALAALLDAGDALRPYHDLLRTVAEPMAALAGRVLDTCVESPPAHLREGGLIRDGVDAQLDEYRGLQRDSNTWLAQYQKDLIDETGIPSLKVGYNKVFGYYIEVTAAHRHKVDDNAEQFRAWTRKQTLKNAERFITPPLKEYESKVLNATTRAVAREQALFTELCAAAQSNLDALQTFAQTVAELDVLACFARRAVRHRYVRPTIVDEPVLHIKAGRHPVLDELLGDRFVPNDVELGTEGEESDTKALDGSVARSLGPSLALITGPNMAGKSTYIRQTALIALLAHTGSFVPADEANIGLCDRIFTRIGASDELHAGQSTFMVEMTETANICHHATPASLVILDEIGRGTSTLDGLSLAWAIAEHLAQRRCRSLFATHYHELTDLASRYDNVINLNVTVREWKDQVVFLHRIAQGKTDRSYGIHVARIAGLPDSVVKRADALLAELEVKHRAGSARGGAGNGQAADESTRKPQTAPADDMPLFSDLSHPVVDALREADLNRLSPLEAFDLLRDLAGQLDKPESGDA